MDLFQIHFWGTSAKSFVVASHFLVFTTFPCNSGQTLSPATCLRCDHVRFQSPSPSGSRCMIRPARLQLLQRTARYPGHEEVEQPSNTEWCHRWFISLTINLLCNSATFSRSFIGCRPHDLRSSAAVRKSSKPRGLG